MDQQPTGPTVPGLSDLTSIGSGGFGVVYRAQDREHDRRVAVKVLDVRGLDAAAQRAFDRERRAMGALSGHPNIVTVYRSGLTGEGRPFIVMEHLSGGSLADAAADAPFGWRRVIEIGVKIAGALQAAHDMGIVHRDVKPANILLDAWDEPKLGDFGIAQVTGATTSTTGGTSASIAHAAPEVLDGQPATFASDLYSLASTLHELLSGQAPFVRVGDVSLVPIIARVLTQRPPDLRQSGIPDALVGVLETGMAKAPVDRFASAAAFAQRLGEAREQQHGPATVATQANRGEQRAAEPVTAPVERPRRRPVIALGVAVTLLAVGVLWGVLRSSTPGPTEGPAAATPSELASTPTGPGPDTGGPAFGEIAFRGSTDSGFRVGFLPGLDQPPVYLTDLGEAGRPALSPAGDRVALTLGGALHVRDGPSEGTTVLVPDGARDPAWSPDGDQIAYAADVGGQMDLFVVSADGVGAPMRITDTPANEGSPAWSPDGELLAHDTDVSGDFDIWVIHIDGSGSLQLTSGPADDETPTYHPDGNTIAFVRREGGSNGNLWTIGTDGTSIAVALTTDAAEHTGPSYAPDGSQLAFASDADGDLDLYVLDVVTGTVRVLLGGPGLQVDPDWRGGG